MFGALWNRRGCQCAEGPQRVHMSQHEARSHYQPENGHSGLDDPLAAAATRCEGANLGSDVTDTNTHTHTHGRGTGLCDQWCAVEISVHIHIATSCL